MLCGLICIVMRYEVKCIFINFLNEIKENCICNLILMCYLN